MKINELIPESKVESLVVKIMHLDESNVMPGGKTVREGVVEDDTGQAKISLWNEQCDKFKVGETIMLRGWCKKFKEDIQVSSGLHGKIVKV